MDSTDDAGKAKNGNRTRTLALIVTVFVFAGCGSVPPLPEFDSQDIDRVGVHIAPIGDPTHTHVGTTIFNNFATPYEQDWALASEFESMIGSALREKGMTPVGMDDLGLTYEDLIQAINLKGTSWQVDNADVLARLERAELSAVVTVGPIERLAVMQQCSMYGCSDHFAEGYGIFSRGVFGNANFFAAFAFEVVALLVEPPAEITHSQELIRLRTHKHKSRPWSDPLPGDLGNIDAVTWERLHEDLLEQMGEYAEAIASVLAGEPIALPDAGGETTDSGR
ncbi:MAG: hypothetical protein OXE40_19515 [Gammaproteobacteria bacterium]|nr:hypothetical protein [Gammaproteobacteria bacterium]